jgi:TetR/AcrR family transcriptional regulator, transcriptional repressor for nem operon
VPREREFSAEDVIETAADVFAEHGYGGTSMSMLLDATGLGKQSLYNAFGDKAGLYLKAVDCAVTRMMALTEGMAEAETGRQAIAMFFSKIVEACCSDDLSEKTCIISSGLLEDIDDAMIRQTLATKWASTHELLRASVERGQRDGSIAARSPSAELADVLMSVMSGLRVLARTPTSPARLAAAARLSTSVLDTP